ncbi:MAG: DNA-3-methyladenine glycosylase I [Chromatiales bacterium]|jgi:DNA-3-methyladenine glycosylase I|nr:DNA-3-methyladenine glycosylase I [Chromatiales bacterium]MDX9766330.1 DNA-3-methyladenine glycosylase I [Ectothiorhodospiraceae bacterium]
MNDPTENRCPWCLGFPEYVRYHDEEWGVPSFDDVHLFEMLILEGAQAGLSWATILKKREHYRKVFDGFDAAKIARYTPRRIDRLLADPGIVRNRQKVEGTVINARLCLDLRDEEGGLADWLWRFVDGRPVVNHFRDMREIPATTPQSDAMSRELKRRGFKFVGSTICYAFMQAVGMVNDHLVSCPRHRAVQIDMS